MCLGTLGHSVISDSVTPWIITSQAPLSMGFPRQEYGNRLPFPSSRDLPNLVIETESPVSTAFQVDSFTPLSHQGSLNSGHIRQCILGWPQSSFKFFHVTKTQRNFLASGYTGELIPTSQTQRDKKTTSSCHALRGISPDKPNGPVA